MNPLEEPRQVTAEWHIVQVQRLLTYDGGRHLDTVLVYAAVELRAAIERTLFEILYLLKEQQVSDEEVTQCRSIQGMIALMQETDRAYRKTIEFTRLVASVTPGFPEVSAIDTAYLLRRWRDLSQYCHLQFKPEDTFHSPARRFQEEGFGLVTEVLGRFLEWHLGGEIGLLALSSLRDETRQIYDKFVAGQINAAQARRMLELAEPILRRRLDLRP